MRRGIKSLALLFYFTTSVVAQNYSSLVFTKDQGLADSYVYSVTQDQEGFLWISTGNGLQTFDGQFFNKINNEGLKGDIIYSSVRQKSGELWFGTSSGNLFSIKKGNKELIPFSQNTKASISKIISSAYNDDLFLNTIGNGIFIKRKNELIHLSGSEEHQINAFVELSSDFLALATSEGLFSMNLKNKEIKKINNIEGGLKGILKIEKKVNCFIVYTSLGDVYEVTLASSGELEALSRWPGCDSLKGKDIKCTNLDGSNLVIATVDAKLFVYDLLKNNLKDLTEYFNGSTNSIYCDNEKNWWISTTGSGLYRLTKTHYEFLGINTSVNAIAGNNAGLLYFGSNAGILVQTLQSTSYEKVILNKENALKKVTALYYADKSLWIGTDANGLIVTDEFYNPVSLDFSAIKNISVNSISGNEDKVTVSTNLDGVYNYKKNILEQHFSVQNSLLHNNVYDALPSFGGNVYYATHNTSFNYSNGKQLFEIDTKPLGMISDFNAFAQNNKAEMAIATNGDGIYLMNNDSIVPFEFNNKLESKYCNGVHYDKENNLWIVTQNHLYKYTVKDKVLNEIKFPQRLQLIFNPRAYYMNAEGDMFFGTNRDVIKFSAKKVVNKLPQPYLISVTIQDSVMDNIHAKTFPSGSYQVSFAFSALCLRNSEDVRFSYLLEGRDEQWSELSTQRSIQFSKLTEGQYTLKVKAYNSEGFTSGEVQLYAFTIAAPYWKSRLFWGLAVVFLSSIIFLVIKIRTRALIQSKEKLEVLVQEKTKELRKEKELVEKSNLKIEEQNQEIKDSITYAKRIQDALLAGTDLFASNKNMFVFFQPRDIVSGDFYWVAEMGKLKIIVSADCTGHGVPGALMSMIGTTLLNKIVLEKRIVRPKQILSELDNEIKQALKQHTEGATRDGMDVCLCCLDTENNKVIYAGAMRPLFLVRNHQLIEYSPTKLAIGGFAYGKNKLFEEIEIDIEENDMFYLFSDGYADQFGGENGKKLMLKNFKKILISIAEMELPKQQENLKRVFNNWKGELDQIDDVLVIGFKITL